MCRLLAYAAPTPRTVADALGPQALAAFSAMARVHADGWGTAHVAGDTLAMVKSAHSAATDAGYLAATTGRRAFAGIAHLRLASPGLARTPFNTHPFLAADARWAFAHNGGAQPAHLIEPLLDPSLRAGLAGATDSERYAALVATHRRRGLPSAHAAAAAVADLRPLFPTASLNAVLLTTSELIIVHASAAARAPYAEFDARGLGEADLPPGHGDGYFQLWSRRSADGTFVVSSAGLPTEGWVPLAPETVTRVDLSTLLVSTVPIQVRAAAPSRVVAPVVLTPSVLPTPRLAPEAMATSMAPSMAHRP